MKHVRTCKSPRWAGDHTYQAGQTNRRDRLRVRKIVTVQRQMVWRSPSRDCMIQRARRRMEFE
ncbi:BZ3500_MvSof-1268-A1-R1_Chr11-1g03116 [Microbotryum saponariae]|uniref:BZ3500_MvSof-1268-A1-R1_Chr11-1g03116 protein n=1 Tax=Microbotryum saponariae TaxID=289078 RepID=A0A2X0LD36_9BASI|nr:BZ3501_MvSof-1269-A2-R1_Chr11g02691 [Microbotryum saponariae]SDA03676.1 BZ3500_MvSof-1268-A1-R1_Chr11-1g03116 [Microbotryum saponariae]